MCLVVFAYRRHPRYPLLVAANRDEFHQRPTAPSSFWPEHPDLLAGRDLQAGGTWMGLHRNGRFAAITNYRDPSRTAPGARSRGELPLAWLNGREAPGVFLQQLAARGADYAGFNLLVGDRRSLWYLSNSGAAEHRLPRQLKPGIYGLSNAQLDTPWPKVVMGREALRSLPGGRIGHDLLAGAVSSRALASHAELHRQGLGGDMDQLLSAQFIVNERYGSRATTTLWIDEEGIASWRELRFDPAGEQQGKVLETLELVDA